jgi:hypothetical protein
MPSAQGIPAALFAARALTVLEVAAGLGVRPNARCAGRPVEGEAKPQFAGAVAWSSASGVL